MAIKKKKAPASVSSDNRDWIIQKHAMLLGTIHDDLCKEGFSFQPRKTRFWVRKDNGISVSFIYSKQGPSWTTTQAVLARLTIKGQTLFVDRRY